MRHLPLEPLSRRSFAKGALALGLVATPLSLRAATPTINVFKDPDCGCCGAWMRIMAEAGFKIGYKDVSIDELYEIKSKLGIPQALASCHTGLIGDYVIEGHVPPADVFRLLDEQPVALGLSVPGMPFGSPGMGPEDERDAYQVMLIRRSGAGEVFTDYPAGARL